MSSIANRLHHQHDPATWMRPFRSVAGMSGYTLLRVVVGVIMAAHGAQKFADFDTFEQQIVGLGVPVPEVSARLAVAGELMGGLGLIVGLLTPIAAFGVLATMTVAILTVHLEHGLFAKDGGFEYPLTILCAALCFLLNGGGAFSLDALLAEGISRRRKRRAVPTPPAPDPYARRPFRPSGELPSDGFVDPVTRAGMESFPASDPPAHSASMKR